MRKAISNFLPAVAVAAVLAATSVALGQDLYTQTVTLRPGWSAIYLEVAPDPNDIADVFSATNCGGAPVPLASIWTYDRRTGAVDAPPDPAAGLREETGWHGYYPPTSPEALLNNLFSVTVNTPYLVHLNGTTSVQCNITGIPKLRRRQWTHDSFNLVGFAVDPQSPPSFGAYLQPSAAHAGQAIFRLTTNGVWVPVLPYLEPIRAGEAYWVFTNGRSEYQGPLEIDLTSDRLEFGAGTAAITVEAINHLDIDTAVAIEDVTSPAVPFLLYERDNDTNAGSAWLTLLQGKTWGLRANDSILIDLAPDRDAIPDRVQNIIAVTNGLGARILLLAGANVSGSGTPNSDVAGFADSLPGGLASPPANGYAGLWVGDAKVRAVQEVRCVPQRRGTCSTSAAPCDSDANCPSDEVCITGCECQETGTCDVSGHTCGDFTDCPLIVESCLSSTCSLTGGSCSEDTDCPGATQRCLSNLVNPGDALLCGGSCGAGETCVCPERGCDLPRTCNQKACAGNRSLVCSVDSDCVEATGEPFTGGGSGVCADDPATACADDAACIGAGKTGPCVVAADIGPCRDATCFTDVDCPLMAESCVADTCGDSGADCSVDADCPGTPFTCSDPVIANEAMPTGGEFRLRLVVHVDDDGQATLLKEVIQLFRDATMGPDPALPGFDTLIDAGEFVLITDDERIVDFQGVAQRDGVRVGQRISTVAYDFDESSLTWDASKRGIKMGRFDATGGSTITAQFVLPRVHPTNPYRHRYHPDLNNLDEESNPLGFCRDEPLGPSCATDLDCVGACTEDAAVACTEDPDCVGSALTGASGVCAEDEVVACTENPDCVGPALTGASGVCADDEAVACAEDLNCTGLGLAGPCVDYDGPCVDYDGPCLDYPGPCLPRPGSEVPAIHRTIDLTFDLAGYSDYCPTGCPDDDPCGGPGECPCDCSERPADWGAAVVGGTYTESVTGLHRIPIQATGVFELRRVSGTVELNPQP